MAAKHRRLVGAASVAAPAVRALVLLRDKAVDSASASRRLRSQQNHPSPDLIDGELACLDQLHGEGKAGFSSSMTRCSPLQYN